MKKAEKKHSFGKYIFLLASLAALCSGCSANLSSPAQTDQTLEELPASSGTSLILSADAILHSSPSAADSSSLCVIPAGSTVDVVSQSGSWVRVLYRDSSGYLYESFLTASSETNAETAAAYESPIHALTDEELSAISAVYDGTPTGYGCGGNNRDEQNRAKSALNLEKTLAEFNPIIFGDQSSKTIYLSFSMGWENAPNTSEILDTLAAENVKAVFYVTHEYALRNPELIERMINEGHEIGSEGYEHPSDGIPSLPLAEQMEDALKMQDFMQETYGYTLRKYNFSSSCWSMASVALMTQMGYRVCFYSFNYADYDVSKPMDESDVYDLLIGALTPGCIYYLHAVSTGNTAALPRFINDAMANGYRFGIIDNL